MHLRIHFFWTACSDSVWFHGPSKPKSYYVDELVHLLVEILCVRLCSQVTYSQSYTIDGVKKDMKYHTLARSGDEFKDFGTGKSRIGMLTDINGQIINLQNDDGSKSDKPDISVNPDYVSFLERDGKLYSIAHFESPRPGTSYWMELSQDATTGLLSIVKTAPLDFSKLGGCWVPCAGSKTPWESHLG